MSMRLAKSTKNIKHRGKIFRGAAFSSLYKSSYGSIPSKAENFLIPENVHNVGLDGFVSHSERFGLYDDDNPGVGNYNLGLKPKYITNTSMSSKGYGNGFLSRMPRLNSNNNGNPGPGKYDLYNVLSIKKETESSLVGRSLYNNNETVSKKENLILPGPATYSPSKFDGWRLDKSKFNYNFDSSSKRKDFVDSKTNYPGPGSYFIDKPKKESTLFKTEISKEDSNNTVKLSKEIINRYNIKTKQNKKDLKFQLYNGDKTEHLLKKHIYTIAENTSTLHQTLTNNSHCNTTNEEIEETPKPQKTYETEPIDEEVEYRVSKPYRRKVMKKKELFELASPRWKKSPYDLKIPGPAYYITKNPRDKYSYNRNNKDFICPGGPEFN